ncbi:MAG: D-glycero-beta-D-manno-heptose 1-phosphate adenylyltransferase [Bacteroidales bacterium]
MKLTKEIIQSKILDKESLPPVLARLRFRGMKIVFTNGCFDILHHGHIDYLSKAKDLGNILMLGLNTDSSIKQIKGNMRPVQDEESRKFVMASLHFVDYVIPFSEETPYNLIKTIQPDVLVKGADYKKEEIAGYDIVEDKSGKIVTVDLLEGYSTSSIIEKIKQS